MENIGENNFFVKQEKPEEFTLILPADERTSCYGESLFEECDVKTFKEEDFIVSVVHFDTISDDDEKVALEVSENLFELDSCPDIVNILNSTKQGRISQKGRYDCGECGRVFKTKQNLIRHTKNSHDQYYCDICGKTLMMNTIKRHMKKHLSRYICFMCPEGFKSKSALLQHARKHDEGKLKIPYPYDERQSEERPFKCNICPWRFKSKSVLKSHLAYIHSDDRPFKCNFPSCGRRYKVSPALKDHQRSVHIEERKECCRKCPKKFKLIHQLKEHILRVHEKPKERKFVCVLCQKKFFNNLDLKVHHKRSHGGWVG